MKEATFQVPGLFRNALAEIPWFLRYHQTNTMALRRQAAVPLRIQNQGTEPGCGRGKMFFSSASVSSAFSWQRAFIFARSDKPTRSGFGSMICEYGFIPSLRLACDGKSMKKSPSLGGVSTS